MFQRVAGLAPRISGF